MVIPHMSLKKQFKFKDRLIKGIHKDGHFKVSVVKTTEVVRAAKKNHDLSLLNTVLLGRTLTASMLLASELKGEERLQLRLDGNGPVGMVVAEANRAGEIRGYVQNPSAELDYSEPDVSIEDGIGLGILTVSKTLYNEAEPRTSSIELVKGDVIADLAHFMVQSEQILSAFLLDVSLTDEGELHHAGGLLVQRMPGAEEATMEKLQKTVSELPLISDMFNDGKYIDDIMELSVAPFEVKELDRQPVHFFCRCSQERFRNALALLSYDDLKEMEGESQETVCHFCNSKYTIPKEEVYSIIRSARAKLN
jgi:molecular chaperone Hsp33